MPDHQHFFEDIALVSEALQAGNSGLWKIVVDPQAGIAEMFANDMMLKLLGLTTHPTPAECYDWWFSRIDSHHAPRIANTVNHAFQSGGQVEVEYPWAHPHWGIIYVRCGGKLIPSTDNKFHMMGYHQNITELHAAKLSLQESTNSLEMACNIGNFGIFKLFPTENGLELTSNKLFGQQLHVNTEQPATAVWEDIAENLQAQDQVVWLNLLNWEKWQLNNRIKLEFRYFHAEKQDYWLSFVCDFFLQGEDIYAVGYITDITASKLYELNLFQDKERAEASSISKSTFLAHMSHEIRTPMNAVLNMADLTLKTDLTPTQHNYISKIRLAGGHMLKILNDILDFSKIEANKMTLEIRPFNLRHELQAVFNLGQEWAEAKGLNFTWNIDPEIPASFLGDALRVRQILVNLTSNAIKFTEKGNISLNVRLLQQTEKEQYLLSFSVQDMGIGMSAQEQANLFTPFMQADTSITRRFGGTGLGLTISSLLAQLMDGRITVTSTPNVGSIFCLELPFFLASEPKQVVVQELPSLKGLRVLVAEDNELNQEIIRAILEEQGIEVVIANNGQELLNLYSQDQNFHCILMDVQMPILDGYAATRSLRNSSLPKAKTIPVLAMTANAMRGDDQKSLDCGMNAHLTKPINVEELIHALSVWGNI